MGWIKVGGKRDRGRIKWVGRDREGWNKVGGKRERGVEQSGWEESGVDLSGWEERERGME